jgi:hypothetical protein
MTELMSPRRVREPSAATAPAALLLSALAGLFAGVATSWLQSVLPGSWHVLADSGAVWTAVAFLVAAAVSGPRWLAVGSGTLCLLAEVAGYYLLAAAAQGIAVTMSEQVLWTLAAMWIGPLAGIGGHLLRRGTPALRLLALLAMAGVVAGEGLHQLLRVSDASAGYAELGVAGLVTVVGAAVIPARLDRRAWAVAGGAAVAVATYVMYGQTVFG